MFLPGGAATAEDPLAGAAAQPAITVIVPTLRRAMSLRECLLGLSNQLLPAAQILVVVRADDDETHAALPTLHRIVPFEVVSVARAGQTHALNSALALARGEIVAFIDDDAIAKRDWLERIAAHYEDPSVGAVGGKLIVPRETAAGSDDGLRVGSISRFGRPVGNHHLADGTARDVQWLRGANMSYRRRLCRFDESLRGSGAQVANDSEASLRVHAAGWRVVYEPAAQVFHNAAPRNDADQRAKPSNAAIRDAAYNETLVLLRWLPAGDRLRAAVYMLLVGVPRTPGPVGAARAVLIGRRPPLQTIARSVHSTLARLAALRDWRRGRANIDRATHNA